MLPYWDSDLDMEVAPWFPWGVDYQPVSINHLYSAQLISIATRCLAFDSEFLFMASPRMGCVGSLMRDGFYSDPAGALLSLGFMMILGYSPRMERLVDAALEPADGEDDEDIIGGVALCSLWNKGVLVGSLKVIALVSDGLFFDETKFLSRFEGLLSAPAPAVQEEEVKGKARGKPPEKLRKKAEANGGLSFFAEKFGYRRFFVPYETDDPLQLRISQLLYEMEFAETRQMVGPSPEVPFPPFLGVALSGFMS